MSKVTLASQHSATSETPCPARNHQTGASISSMALRRAPAEPRKILPRLANARSALRHCRAKESRPEVTMQETPPHSVHLTRSWYSVPWMTPWCWRIGTKTAQQSVPPIIMLADTRIPVRAPAAMKIGSQTNATVRSVQVRPEPACSAFRPTRLSE